MPCDMRTFRRSPRILPRPAPLIKSNGGGGGGVEGLDPWLHRDGDPFSPVHMAGDARSFDAWKEGKALREDRGLKWDAACIECKEGRSRDPEILDRGAAFKGCCQQGCSRSAHGFGVKRMSGLFEEDDPADTKGCCRAHDATDILGILESQKQGAALGPRSGITPGEEGWQLDRDEGRPGAKLIDFLVEALG